MSNRAPVATLALLVAGWAAHLGTSLPASERIATRFDASGTANGWMSRAVFVGFEVGLLGFVAVVTLGIGALVRVLPVRFINIPNRDYWFAPERRQASSARLSRHLLWLLCGIVAFVVCAVRRRSAEDLQRRCEQLVTLGKQSANRSR